MLKTTRKIFGFECQGTEKQLQEMYNLMNYEEYWTTKFKKYFNVWVKEGYGVWFFPKEKYFKSYQGITNYAVAMFNYSGDHNVYESELNSKGLYY